MRERERKLNNPASPIQDLLPTQQISTTTRATTYTFPTTPITERLLTDFLQHEENFFIYEKEFLRGVIFTKGSFFFQELKC